MTLETHADMALARMSGQVGRHNKRDVLLRQLRALIRDAVAAERERCRAVLLKQLAHALGRDASPNCPHCADHLRAAIRHVERPALDGDPLGVADPAGVE